MNTAPLKRFVDPARPITYGIVQAGPDIPGGIPYIRPVDMDDHRGVRDPGALRTTSPEIAASYRRSTLRAGDVVVSIGPSYGKTMIVPKELDGANLTQGTARVAPAPGVDRRYLRWSLQSRPAAGFWNAAVGGATFRALNLGPLCQTPIPFWKPAQQRAIADFLDLGTARLDEIIIGKRRLSSVVEERQRLLLVDELRQKGFTFPNSLAPDWRMVALPSGWDVIRLSQVLEQLTNGYVGPTRDILQEEGIPYIQSLHVKQGVIDFARRPFFVSKEWFLLRPRIQLRRGDVLIVQTGDIGQVAVVPPDMGQACCHALQIARVRRDLITGEYLADYLRTPFGYESLLSRATGALHPHLEGSIRDVPVVVPPLSIQAEMVASVDAARREHQRFIGSVSSHVRLLEERRQALITAAVTGQLEIRRRHEPSLG